MLTVKVRESLVVDSSQNSKLFDAVVIISDVLLDAGSVIESDMTVLPKWLSGRMSLKTIFAGLFHHSWNFRIFLAGFFEVLTILGSMRFCFFSLP